MPMPGAPSLTGRGRGSVRSPAAASAAGVGSNVRGAAALGRVAVACGGDDAFFAAVEGFLVAVVFDVAVAFVADGLAAGRRVPIRSGLVDGSAASTPFSSFFGFAFFFGFSTLSAMALRVYGS